MRFRQLYIDSNHNVSNDSLTRYGFTLIDTLFIRLAKHMNSTSKTLSISYLFEELTVEGVCAQWTFLLIEQ